MDAVVTIKCTPTEWATILQALTFYKSNQESVAKDGSTDVKTRHEARMDSARASELLRKVA